MKALPLLPMEKALGESRRLQDYFEDFGMIGHKRWPDLLSPSVSLSEVFMRVSSLILILVALTGCSEEQVRVLSGTAGRMASEKPTPQPNQGTNCVTSKSQDINGNVTYSTHCK